MALSGAELADGSNCISRSRSRFWTNYANAFEGDDFIFGAVQLKARSDPNGGVAYSVMLTRVPGTFAGSLRVPSTLVVLDSPTVLLACPGMPHCADELLTTCSYCT